MQPEPTSSKQISGKLLISDHRAYMYQFRCSFVGEEAVTWALGSELNNDHKVKLASRADAVYLFESFLTLGNISTDQLVTVLCIELKRTHGHAHTRIGAIQHVNHSQYFRDAAFLYRWQDLAKLAPAPDSAPLVRESAMALADIAAKLLRSTQFSKSNMPTHYICHTLTHFHVSSLHTTIDGRTKTTLAEWEQNTLPLIKAKIQVKLSSSSFSSTHTQTLFFHSGLFFTSIGRCCKIS